MANKYRALIYSIFLYVALCLFAFYYKIYEAPLLPEATNDIDLHVNSIAYPLSFIFNFILALLFYLAMKLVNYISRRFKE